MDDDLDPELAERFGQLGRIDPPDTWSRIRRADDGALRRGWPLVAALLLVLALAAAAVAVVAGNSADETIAADDGRQMPEPTAGEVVGGGESSAGPCDVEALARTLGRGEELPDYHPSESPADLDRRGLVLRGELTGAVSADGSTAIAVRTGDYESPDWEEFGAAIDTIVVPVPIAGPGPVSGRFVAVVGWTDGPQYAAQALVEGLWVACDDGSAAVSVMAEPTGEEWEAVVGDGVSLDELWSVLGAVDEPESGPSAPTADELALPQPAATATACAARGPTTDASLEPPQFALFDGVFRFHDRDGCAVRWDVVRWTDLALQPEPDLSAASGSSACTLPPFVTFGDALGSQQFMRGVSVFLGEPNGLSTSFDAVLPEDAVDSGWSIGVADLWLDPQERYIWLRFPDHTERWPRMPLSGCQ